MWIAVNMKMFVGPIMHTYVGCVIGIEISECDIVLSPVEKLTVEKKKMVISKNNSWSVIKCTGF